MHCGEEKINVVQDNPRAALPEGGRAAAGVLLEFNTRCLISPQVGDTP